MASVYPLGPFKIEVKFERREDGGLRATCDRVPSFLLSHSDGELLMADVEPALEVILTAMYGVPMSVQRLSEMGDSPIDTMPPAHVCATQEYVGLTTVQ